MLPVQSSDRGIALALRQDAGDARRLASTFRPGGTTSDLHAFAKALEQQARKAEGEEPSFRPRQDF